MRRFLIGLVGSRAVRPLLVWVAGLLAYVVLPLPQELVLVLIVGLGVALAMTVARVRERLGLVRGNTGRAWEIAERLARAVEDRIRGELDDDAPIQVPQPVQSPYGHIPLGGPEYGYSGEPAAVYDPGALLSAIAAVVEAEGLPVDAGRALHPVMQLLANQNIGCEPGPAPTAHGLVNALRPGAPRRARVMPAGLLASVIRAVLTHDSALSQEITTDDAHYLITDSAAVLIALQIQPGDAGSLDDWPVIAEIVNAAPLPAPYEAS